MNKIHNYIILILIFLVLILIYINPLTIWNFKRYLISFSNNQFTNCQNLEQENLILKNKINQFNILNQFLSNKIKNVWPVFVYSKYPFNLKNELLINLSNNKNFSVDDVVVLLNNSNENNFILIGKIKEIYDNFAVVQTIFDPNFKLSVKIGKNLENGLFVGGPNPKITLITRDAKINKNDVIISADHNLPYGLIIGSIDKINEVPNTLFNEAEINFSYDLNLINIVGIINK